MDCKNCGAPIDISEAVCHYCGTAIKPDRQISEEDSDFISNFAISIEERIESHKNKYDWLVFIIFLILSAGCIGLYFLYSHLINSTTIPVILTIVSGSILFIAWGGVITILQKRAIDSAYQTEIKPDIDRFLGENDFYRYSFDIVAQKELPEEAILRRFLYDL